MQITDYLSLYLLLNQKVGLKGIGTITLKHFNGFHENETNTLYPPAVHLIFEKNYTLDSDFAKFISEQQNININEAHLKLDIWLLNIKTELNNGNTYILNKIGSLKSQNQKIQFTSCDNAYFNQSNFGFKPQHNIVLNDDDFLNAIEAEENIIAENSLPELEPTHKEVHPSNTLQDSIKQPSTPVCLNPLTQIIPTKNAQKEPTPQQKIDWFWIMAIIIVCLTGAMVCATFIYFPPFKPVVLEIPLEQNNNTVDSLAAIVTIPDTTLTYNIIVAENLTPLKAQRQLLKLKTVGIYGSLITNDSTIIVQISAATYLNLDSAQAKLNQIQNKYYPKAYLKTIKSIN